MTRIIHFTTVHPREDVRIRLKEVVSLASHLSAEVMLYVQDGKGDEALDDPVPYRIVDTGPPEKGRLKRVWAGALRMYRAVRAARPDVAHFHDPELIPVGMALRLSGIKVVYDVHEDLPRQIQGKAYIPALLRRPIAAVAALCEWAAGRCFNGIAAATPIIGARFPAQRTIVVRNFPITAEFNQIETGNYLQRPLHFAYVGGIAPLRGSVEMVTALSLQSPPGARLQLAGAFGPAHHQGECEALDGWQRVDFHGWSDRQQVCDVLGRARAGLVVLRPTQSYRESLPIKLFEYMAAGLPVIASDFPIWRKIVDEAGCGLLVDPEDPAAIARAMDWILAHPEEAMAMGERGRRAVNATYNWNAEARTLVAFYRDHLGIPQIQLSQTDPADMSHCPPSEGSQEVKSP